MAQSTHFVQSESNATGRYIQMTSTYKERDFVKLAIEAHGGLEVGVEFPPFED